MIWSDVFRDVHVSFHFLRGEHFCVPLIDVANVIGMTYATAVNLVIHFDQDELILQDDKDDNKDNHIYLLTQHGIHRLLQSVPDLEFQKWITRTICNLYNLCVPHRSVLNMEKTFQEMPRLDKVYIMKEAAELASNTHKVGKSINPKKREATFNTPSAQGVRCLYTRDTVNAKIIEDMVKVAQKRYHIVSHGGSEHYSNSMDHSINIIDIATTVMDTLSSSYENINRDSLLDILIKRLHLLKSSHELQPRNHDVKSHEVKSHEVKSHEVKSHLQVASSVKSHDVNLDMETHGIESQNMETHDMETHDMETHDMETHDMETQNMEQTPEFDTTTRAYNHPVAIFQKYAFRGRNSNSLP